MTRRGLTRDEVERERTPSVVDTTDDGEPRHCECPAAGSYVGPALSEEFYAEDDVPLPTLDGVAPVFAIQRKERYLVRARRRSEFLSSPRQKEQ